MIRRWRPVPAPRAGLLALAGLLVAAAGSRLEVRATGRYPGVEWAGPGFRVGLLRDGGFAKAGLTGPDDPRRDLFAAERYWGRWAAYIGEPGPTEAELLRGAGEGAR